MKYVLMFLMVAAGLGALSLGVLTSAIHIIPPAISVFPSTNSFNDFECQCKGLNGEPITCMPNSGTPGDNLC